jgi:glycosylphosphatidylinositol transamidase
VEVDSFFDHHFHYMLVQQGVPRSEFNNANNSAAAPTLVRKLRNDPYLLFARLPPYVSVLCIVVGIIWLLLLPLDEYSRQTYISENALLPGQVHTYFGGSEQNIFRGFKKELEGLLIDGEASPA